MAAPPWLDVGQFCLPRCLEGYCGFSLKDRLMRRCGMLAGVLCGDGNVRGIVSLHPDTRLMVLFVIRHGI